MECNYIKPRLSKQTFNKNNTLKATKNTTVERTMARELGNLSFVSDFDKTIWSTASDSNPQ